MWPTAPVPEESRPARAPQDRRQVAFIVEMWWGRPSELTVQEGPPDPERRTFSCHGDNWEVARRLGREFG